MFFPRFSYAVFIFSDDSRYQSRQFAAQHCFPHCCEGKNILTRAQENLSHGVVLRLPSDGKPRERCRPWRASVQLFCILSDKSRIDKGRKNGAASGGLKERETTSQHPGSSSPQIAAQVTTQKWVKTNLAGQRITKEVGLIN